MVPSMLPQAEEPTGQSPHTGRPSAGSGTITIDSLRRIKERKRAIAAGRKTSAVPEDGLSFPTLDSVQKAAVVAQQTEIAYLRKERDTIVARLEKLECQGKPNSPDQLQAALERITALEQLVHQCRPPLQRKELQGTDDELHNANNTVQAAVKELVNQQVTEQVTEQVGIANKAIQASIKELTENIESAKKAMRASFDITKTVLTKRCEESSEAILTLSAEVTALAKTNDQPDAKTTVFADEVKSLSDKHAELIHRIDKHMGSIKQAYEKTGKTMLDRVDEHEKNLGRIQKNMDFFNTRLKRPKGLPRIA